MPMTRITGTFAPAPSAPLWSGALGEQVVKLDGLELSPEPSLAVIRHSPDGFAWGYGGSGPSQLALAILMEYTDNQNAVRLHHAFRDDFVAHWPRGSFDVEVDIEEWLDAHQAE